MLACGRASGGIDLWIRDGHIYVTAFPATPLLQRDSPLLVEGCLTEEAQSEA